MPKINFKRNAGREKNPLWGKKKKKNSFFFLRCNLPCDESDRQQRALNEFPLQEPVPWHPSQPVGNHQACLIASAAGTPKPQKCQILEVE